MLGRRSFMRLAAWAVMLATAAAAEDAPNTHNMALIGSHTGYVSHLPMFDGLNDTRTAFTAPHHFQAIMAVEFRKGGRDVGASYVADRTSHPGTPLYTIGPTRQFVLTRLNQVMHGWANYFQHAVAKNVFSLLDDFAWWRVIRMLMVRHHWRWKDVRRQFTDPTGRWLPITAGEIEMRRISAKPVTRYRYRGNTIPNPWVRQPA